MFGIFLGTFSTVLPIPTMPVPPEAGAPGFRSGGSEELSPPLRIMTHIITSRPWNACLVQNLVPWPFIFLVDVGWLVIAVFLREHMRRRQEPQLPGNGTKYERGQWKNTCSFFFSRLSFPSEAGLRFCLLLFPEARACLKEPCINMDNLYVPFPLSAPVSIKLKEQEECAAGKKQLKTMQLAHCMYNGLLYPYLLQLSFSLPSVLCLSVYIYHLAALSVWFLICP